MRLRQQVAAKTGIHSNPRTRLSSSRSHPAASSCIPTHTASMFSCRHHTPGVLEATSSHVMCLCFWPQVLEAFTHLHSFSGHSSLHSIQDSATKQASLFCSLLSHSCLHPSGLFGCRLWFLPQYVTAAFFSDVLLRLSVSLGLHPAMTCISVASISMTSGMTI